MMSMRLTNACILLITMAFCSIPGSAQIVSYLDSTGKRVFVNEEPRTPVRPRLGGVPRLADKGVRPTPFSIGAIPSAQTPARLGFSSQANRAKIEAMIHEVSARHRVDPALIRAVMETESNWNPAAVSRKGALGLMQLVPGTARQMGVTNALDPQQNLEGGAHYLRTLLERYNGDLDKSLAAYNAGPGAVDRAGGVPRYRETLDYVHRVTDSYFRPGSNRMARAFENKHLIYRVVSDGRVVFTNE